MRRDDELRSDVDGAFHHREQPQLALGGKRRFRLVEQVETSGYQTLHEEVEERFAVRGGVRLSAVAPLVLGQRARVRALREPARIGRGIGELLVDAADFPLVFASLARDPLLEAEEVLGAQEEPAVVPPRPG